MHFRSVDDMNHAVLRGLTRVPWDVDLVVGVPRSGMLSAGMMSLYLNKPLTDIDGLRERRLLGKGKRPLPTHGPDVFEQARRILVVDDCVSKGTALGKARRIVEEAGFSDRAVFLCVYSFPEHPELADIVLEIIPRPMCFQWSCMHTPELTDACVDIDGILCPDVPKEDDDDGLRYQAYLDAAPPLIVPSVEVGWLVTCRLEKYRAITERWLRRQGIKYRHLVMMDYESQKAREKAGQHTAYKARVYRESGAQLFIESSPGLAAKIAKQSGLPVLCPITATMFGAAGHEGLTVLYQQSGLDRWLRRIRRAPRRIWGRITAGHLNASGEELRGGYR